MRSENSFLSDHRSKTLKVIARMSKLFGTLLVHVWTFFIIISVASKIIFKSLSSLIFTYLSKNRSLRMTLGSCSTYDLFNSLHAQLLINLSFSFVHFSNKSQTIINLSEKDIKQCEQRIYMYACSHRVKWQIKSWVKNRFHCEEDTNIIKLILVLNICKTRLDKCHWKDNM